MYIISCIIHISYIALVDIDIYIYICVYIYILYVYIYIYVHSLAGCGSQMGMDRSAVMRTSELRTSGLGQVQLVIFGYGSYPLGMYAWVLIGAMAFGSRVDRGLTC